MSAAIKVVNSKDIEITNNISQGYDAGIELENVENVLAQGNTILHDSPDKLLKELCVAINASKYPLKDKKELLREITTFLSKGGKDSSIKMKLAERIWRFIGGKASDCFIQVVAAVASGAILKKNF